MFNTIKQIIVVSANAVLTVLSFVGRTPLSVYNDYNNLQRTIVSSQRTIGEGEIANQRLSEIREIRMQLERVLASGASISKMEDVTGYSGRLIRESGDLSIETLSYGTIAISEDGVKGEYKPSQEMGNYTHMQIKVSSRNVAELLRYIVSLEELGIVYDKFKYNTEIVETRHSEGTDYHVNYYVEMIIVLNRSGR